MARRKDGILDMLTELPWWIGVIVAGVTYLVMRYLLPGLMDDGSMMAPLAQLPRVFALPVACLVLLASAISALRSLLELIGSGRQRSGSSSVGPPRGTVQRPTPASLSRPCPRCGGALVMRRAARGARAGSSFWGCSSFPKCRYTQDVTA
jgi:hypothetical protein